MDLNHRSIAQQIYSLPPLATRELSHIQFNRWSRWTDSNPRPADYKSAALPTELHRHRCFFATVLYYHNRAGMSSLFLKFPEIFLSRSAAFGQIPEKSGANFPRRLFCQKFCSGFYLWALWEPSTISAELITASEFPTTAALTRPSDII